MRQAELEAVVEDLWRQLEKFREDCGSPTYARIAKGMRRSRQTVTDWFAKRSVVPDWMDFELLIHAIDEDEPTARWQSQWRHARAAQDDLRSLKAKRARAQDEPACETDRPQSETATPRMAEAEGVRVSANSSIRIRNTFLAVVIGNNASAQVARQQGNQATLSLTTKPSWAWRIALLAVIIVSTLAVLSPGRPPAATEPPAGTVVFVDEFTTDSGWIMAVDGKPRAPAIDGTLKVTAQAGTVSSGLSANLNDARLVDSIMAVDVARETGRGEYGATCRTYFNSGYKFAVTDTGYAGIFKGQEGAAEPVPLVDWRAMTALDPFGVNHIVMMCQNAGDAVRLQLWINGRHVGSATDSSNPLLGGTLAVYAKASDTQALSVRFDNLTLQKPR